MTKVQAWDIHNKAFVTAWTAPDFEITIPDYSAYSEIDGVLFFVKFHSNASWTITINVNWLWAKELDWLTEISVDDYISIVFDSTKDKFVATKIWWSSWWWVWVTQNVVLWEDVVAWDWKWLVYFGRGQVDTVYAEQVSWWEDVIVWDWTSIKAREKIRVPWIDLFANIMKSKILNIKKNWNPTDSLKLKLYEDDWTTLITDISDIPNIWLSTTYNDYDILWSHSYPQETYSPYLNKNFQTTWDRWITITPKWNLTMDWASSYEWWLTVYCIDDDIILYTTAVWWPNTRWFVLEQWKQYAIYWTFPNSTLVHSTDWTLTSSTINFDVVWYNDWSVWWNWRTVYWIQTTVVSVLATNLNLSWYEWQDIYLEIERDDAQDSSNYYVFNWQDWWDTVEVWDWSNWNNTTNNLMSKTQWQYNFEENKVWLFDDRYYETREADWVVIDSWTTWETKLFLSEWDLIQNNVLVWNKYYWNIENVLIWTQSENSVWDRWIYIAKWWEYIEKIKYNVHNSSGSTNNITVTVYLNWQAISSKTTYVHDGYGTISNVEQILDIYIKYWDVFHTSVSANASINTVSYFSQDYNSLRWFFNTTKPTSHIPFLMWIWKTTTRIQLWINEENNNHEFKDRVQCNPWQVYKADTDWIAIVNRAQDTNWYTDSIDATTVVVHHGGNYSSDVNSLTFVVKAWDYYKLSNWWRFYPLSI